MFDIETIIAKNIKIYRRAKGMTQKTLTDAVNITPSYLGYVERGQKVPSLQMLCNIANALEINPGELLSLSPDPISLELKKLLGTLSGKEIESIKFINEVAIAYFKSLEPETKLR